MEEAPTCCVVKRRVPTDEATGGDTVESAENYCGIFSSFSSMFDALCFHLEIAFTNHRLPITSEGVMRHVSIEVGTVCVDSMAAV